MCALTTLLLLSNYFIVKWMILYCVICLYEICIHVCVLNGVPLSVAPQLISTQCVYTAMWLAGWLAGWHRGKSITSFYFHLHNMGNEHKIRRGVKQTVKDASRRAKQAAYCFGQEASVFLYCHFTNPRSAECTGNQPVGFLAALCRLISQACLLLFLTSQMHIQFMLLMLNLP